MRLRKRTVDKVVKEGFWKGFQAGLGGGLSIPLEYSYESRLHDYNDIRRIAADAGYKEAERLIDAAIERRSLKAQGKRVPLTLGYDYKVPGEVYEKCYAEAKIGLKVSRKD